MVKICFICGLTDQETQIDNHDIIPKAIKIPIKFNRTDNYLHVCTKCHQGIHNSGTRLHPGTRHWVIISKQAKKVRNHNDLNALIRFVVQMTIIDKLKHINQYHEFLEYKEFYSYK